MPEAESDPQSASEIIKFIETRIEEHRSRYSRNGFNTWVLGAALTAVLGVLLNELGAVKAYPAGLGAVFVFLVFFGEVLGLLVVVYKAKSLEPQLITAAVKQIFPSGSAYLLIRASTAVFLIPVWRRFDGHIVLKMIGYYCLCYFIASFISTVGIILIVRVRDSRFWTFRGASYFIMAIKGFYLTVAWGSIPYFLGLLVVSYFAFRATPQPYDNGAIAWKIGGGITLALILAQFLAVNRVDQPAIDRLSDIRNRLFLGDIDAAKAMNEIRTMHAEE